MKHIRADNSMGKSIVIALRWAQLCSGSEHHILQDTRPIPHLEGTWNKHLGEGMNYCGTTIWFRDKWKYPKQRENDRDIMDMFINSNNIQAENLPILNYTQYYVEER
eukprot:10428228-Ditylum_brightwellii.AAC.1